MNIEVLKNEKNRSGYFINHKALVKVSDWNGDNEELIFRVSEKSGYHPLEYGLYGGSVKKTIRENEYLVIWQTGASCD